MADLRERLMALADDAEGCKSSISRNIALAAARLALDDAAQACAAKAQHDYMESATLKPGIELLRRVAMGNRCDDCAQDIRAMREGLA